MGRFMLVQDYAKGRRRVDGEVRLVRRQVSRCKSFKINILSNLPNLPNLYT